MQNVMIIVVKLSSLTIRWFLDNCKRKETQNSLTDTRQTQTMDHDVNIHVFVESIRNQILAGKDPRTLPDKSVEVKFWV